MHEADDELYFAVDEKGGTIDLTDKGREFLSKLSHQDTDLFLLPDVGTEIAAIESDASIPADDKIQKKDAVYRLFADRSEKLHNISQLLRAYSLFERDDEYVVQNGMVMIVEGLPYFAFPERMREWILKVAATPDRTLRGVGTVLMLLGLLLVALGRA
jgi:preprotein translocase subunit SecA